MRPHRPGRGLHFLVGGVQPAIADVVHDSAAENKAVLKHDAHLAAQGVESDAGDVIFAVQHHLTAGEVIEPADKIDHRGLAGPRRPHQGHALTLPHGEGEVLQNIDARLVGEGHVTELHLAPDGGQRLRAGQIVHHHRFVHGFKNAFQVRDVIDEHVVDVGQVGDGLPEAADILPHGQQHAEGYHGAANPVHASDVHHGEDDLADDFGREPHGVAHIDSLQPSGAAGGGQPLHDGDVLLLPGEQLADAHAVDALREVGVIVGVFVGLGLPVFPLAGLDVPDDRREKRETGHHDRSQQRVGGVHEHDDKRHVDDFQDAVDDAVGQHVGHRVDVVDDPH